MIVKEDWYPIPIVSGVTRIVEALFGKPQYQLSSHFACGMSTFVYKQGDEVVFGKFSGTTLKWDDEEYLLLDDMYVVGLIKNDL